MPSHEKSTSSSDESVMPGIEHQGIRPTYNLQHGE